MHTDRINLPPPTAVPSQGLPATQFCQVDFPDDGVCLHSDCQTCMDTRKRGFVLCRLSCGHTIRAQFFETECNWSYGTAGVRSESPSLVAVHQRDHDCITTSPP